MKQLILITFVLTFLFASNNLRGQILFDLSDSKTTTETIEIKTNPVIQFKNLISGGSYTFEINLSEEEVPRFNYSSLAGSPCTMDPTNTALLAAIVALKAETKESNMPDKIKSVISERDKLDKIKYADCIKYANDLINTTTYVKSLQFELRNNQTITVKVTGNGSTWTKIFKTAEKSPWLIHYGFTHQPNVVSKYEQYYADPIGKTDSFYVAKKNTSATKFWENISPTIMFTYPFGKKRHDVELGFTAIASTNFSSFSGGFGFSAIVGTNVIVGTGVNFSQKYVLKGEYKTDGTQVIRENLAFDQLHEKKWGPEIYLTLGFRFDKNPFSGESDKETKK